MNFAFSVPRTITVRNSPGFCLDAQETCKIPPCDTRLFIWECNGHASQQWLFDTGSYKLVWAVDPTKCIDGGTLAIGTGVFLWGCNGQKQQTFGYDPKFGTIYFSDTERNADGNSSSTGAEHSTALRWPLTARSPSSTLSTARRRTASSPDASLCLDSGPKATLGNRVVVASCTGLPPQQFNVMWGTTIRVYDQYHACLDLMGGNTAPGTLVQIWDCNGLNNQQWVLDPKQRRIIYGGNIGNGDLMCLDGSTMGQGNRLMIWGCNGYKQQNWGYDPNMKTVYLAQSARVDEEGGDDEEVDKEGVRERGASSSSRELVPSTNASAPLASLCMDLYNGNYQKGGVIQVWGCNTCWNQQWTIGTGFKTATTSQSRGEHTASRPPSRVNHTVFRLPSHTSNHAAARPPSPLLGTCPPLVPVPKNCNKARWTSEELETWSSAAATCTGGWPLFHSALELAASPWCQVCTGTSAWHAPWTSARHAPCASTWHAPCAMRIHMAHAYAHPHAHPHVHSHSHPHVHSHAQYFQGVYGEVPQTHYPICVGDNHVIYKDLLKAANLFSPKAVSPSPTT